MDDSAEFIRVTIDPDIEDAIEDQIFPLLKKGFKIINSAYYIEEIKETAITNTGQSVTVGNTLCPRIIYILSRDKLSRLTYG